MRGGISQALARLFAASRSLRITRGSQTPAVVVPDVPNAERLISDLVAKTSPRRSKWRRIPSLKQKYFIGKADICTSKAAVRFAGAEAARRFRCPAKDVSVEVTAVKDIRDLPPIPRKQDSLRLIDSFCEACNDNEHSIDTCERFPHAESRLERLLASDLCIKCDQSHSGKCQDVSRVCRSCGNCLHMFPLCRKRFGKEVLAAKYHRPDKTSGVAHAKPSSKKRTRKQVN
uniref:Uncharacterized protein n=1 Tax=Caenorhabditis japonica TaxID=281687 RepID=A0A8R1I7U4_CAEJA